MLLDICVTWELHLHLTLGSVNVIGHLYELCELYELYELYELDTACAVNVLE